MSHLQGEAERARRGDLESKPGWAPRPLVTKVLVNRVRREFEDMPGLSINIIEATRLFGIPEDQCDCIISGLVDDGLLDISGRGVYRLRSQV